MRKKHIIIVGYNAEYIDYILDKTDYVIVALATPHIKYDKTNKDRILHIVSTETEGLQHYECDNFDRLRFNDLDWLSFARVETEKLMRRFTNDYQRINYEYYKAVNFWDGIFVNYEIDAFIATNLHHGYLHESIPIAYCKRNKIPEYSIEEMFVDNNLCTYVGIMSYNRDKFIEINSKNPVYIDSMKRYYHKITTEKTGLYSFFYKISGFRGDIVRKEIMMEYRKNKSVYSNFARLSKALINELLGALTLELIFRKRRKPNYFKRLASYIGMRSALNWSKKYSIQPNYNSKYVYFALHFEPEASIMNRGTIDSQLVILKILSESIPNDWTIYVKEHPVQARINTRANVSLFANNIDSYRNKFFYNEIINIPKVKLIDIDISGQTLLANASALVTINGTCALEAMDTATPTLLFGAESTILRYCEGYFHINSLSDSKESLRKILNGFRPQYKDVEHIMQKYLVLADIKTNENYCHEVIEAIMNDCGKFKQVLVETK